MNETKVFCEANGCIDVGEYGERGEYIRVRSSVTGMAMQCTPQEWRNFLNDIAAGKYDHIGKETST